MWWQKKLSDGKPGDAPSNQVASPLPKSPDQKVVSTSAEQPAHPPALSKVSKSVIASAADIPEGVDISRSIGLSSDAYEQFAVLSRSAAIKEGHPVVLLCEESVFRSGLMFDVRRRLERAGLRVASTNSCKSEIIKVVKERSKDIVKAESASDPTKVERCIDELIIDAIKAKASDIHIETREGRADVYFRVNGTRIFGSSFSKETALQMAVVLYTVYAESSSKDVTWDPTQTMDGAIDYSTPDGSAVQLRFSSSPIHPTGNFQVVMRVLSMDPGKAIALCDMGYESNQIRALETMVTGSNGMVLLCGPTNSGKSTSMQGLMRTIFKRRGNSIKVITVEDPVEYIIPGACQIGVAKKRGAANADSSPFTSFLKGTLRQDPDVVMVGEIRDSDSASVVKDLVLAGRKLLTTLHAYSALWAFVRLKEIGVPKSLLTMPGFISGIVYQRLVPVLCSHCSLPIVSPEARGRIPADVFNRVTHVADLGSHNVRVRGDGCERCRHTGISGRTIVAEFVIPDQRLLKLIAEDDNIAAYEYWKDSGVLKVGNVGVTALSHAIHKMRQGLLDPMDVETQVNILTNDMVMADSMLLPEELDGMINQDNPWNTPPQ